MIGTCFTVSIVGVSSLAAEQRCTMVNTSMYDGLLTRVPFLSETLNSLKSAKNIQISATISLAPGKLTSKLNYEFIICTIVFLSILDFTLQVDFYWHLVHFCVKRR